MKAGSKIEPESQSELNLLDVLIVLLKYKWLILSVVLGTTIVASGYFYLSHQRSEIKMLPIGHEPNFFYSECLIEPQKGLMEKLQWLILRRNFVSRMVEENNLRLEIEKAIAKEDESGQSTNRQLSKQDVYRWIRKNLFLTPAGSVLTIGFAATEEHLPPKVVNGIIYSLSEYLRKRDIGILNARQKLLRGRLMVAQDSILKSRIADEIIKVIDKETTVQNARYYGFELLDPPSIIERVKIRQEGNEKKIEELGNWISPISVPGVRTSRQRVLLFLLILVSFVVAVTLAFLLEYIHKMKTREPEKMALLKRYFSIRGK